MKRVVLITGPIGSGKSEVRKYLASKGYPVYDSDSRTKALYKNVPGLVERLEQAIGVPFRDFSVIFEDSAKREKLEEILYPLVLEDMRGWLASQKGDTAFIESAVALGRNCFDTIYNEVWMVDAPFEFRVLRNPKAAQRNSIQIFDASKVTHRIINGSSFENLYEQTDNLL